MRFKNVVLGATGVALSAVVATGYMITNRMMYIKKKKPEEIIEAELLLNQEQRHWYEKSKKTDILIPSIHGYSVHATVIENVPSQKFVIFSHGVTETKIRSIQYAMLFEKHGYNAIIYDQRRHGESGGKTTSFGFYEKYDLKAVVEFAQTFGGANEVGIHGVSMGAATALLYGGTFDDEVNFIVADCPYSSFADQMAHIANYESAYWTDRALQLADLFIKWRDGYRLSEISPIDVVDQIHVPLLLIHTAEDTFILPEMSEKLYERANEPKTLEILPDGAHARGYKMNKERYETVIAQFLKEVEQQKTISS